MKFIRSYAALEQSNRRLLEERQALYEETRHLKVENRQLREQLCQKGLEEHAPSPRRRDSVMSDETTRSSDNSQGSTLSYARPTTSSKNKAANAVTVSVATRQQISDDQSIRYKDGRLVEEDLSRTNLLRHTKSSAAKTIDPCLARWSGVLCFTRVDTWNSGPQEPPTPDSRQIAVTCVQCEVLEAADTITGDESLEIRSRLKDEMFFDTDPASHCTIRFPDHIESLSKALNICRQVVYFAVQRHWPRQCHRNWPEGWYQVRFGREELESQGFGSMQYPGELSAMCEQSRGSIICRMHDVVDLRNRLCHPTYFDLKSTDSLLRRAQNLAIALQDEPRAFEIRALRDVLQQKARDSLAEIEAYELLAELPGAAPWAIHHQNLFYGLRPRQGSEPEGPAVILRAAAAWNSRCIRPGEDNEQFQRFVQLRDAEMKEARYMDRSEVTGDDVDW